MNGKPESPEDKPLENLLSLVASIKPKEKCLEQRNDRFFIRGARAARPRAIEGGRRKSDIPVSLRASKQSTIQH